MKITVPEKLKPLMTTKKRYKILCGGRGSGKSQTVGDIGCFEVAQYGYKIGCMREFQSSIKDSSHSLLKDEIERIGIPGYRVTRDEINHESGGLFTFKGLHRSIDSIKSMHGFDRFHIEEAQFLSEESIRILKPTLRKENSEYWMMLNPGSSDDPVSKEFLVPYWDELTRNGFYEDDLHLIIKVNYCDNPFFPEVLEAERANDEKILDRALYEHIWLGEFNDSVENSLIKSEWFNACVDAHKKLGFKPMGARIASHDPSDTGPDVKGYAMRHGSVVLDVRELATGDINEGGDWALGIATDHNLDWFTWDCDGMGVGLNRQVEQQFNGKHTKISQFKGSEGVDFPDAIYEPSTGIINQKKNKEALKNKRAQYYFELRNRIYRTYEVVNKRAHHDPDKLISFSSDIESLSQLKSELCRMPIKPNSNGLLELYTKEEMKSKFKFRSPNLADSVMMLMRMPKVSVNKSVMPRPIKAMGIR